LGLERRRKRRYKRKRERARLDHPLRDRQEKTDTGFFVNYVFCRCRWDIHVKNPWKNDQGWQKTPLQREKSVFPGFFRNSNYSTKNHRKVFGIFGDLLWAFFDVFS